MTFLGLSFERWKQGFATQREIFDCVSSSSYFDAHCMARSDADQIGRQKAREMRGMYQNFIAYANELASKPYNNQQSQLTRDEIKDATQEAALVFFGKKQLYDKLLEVAKVKRQAKAVFTGKLVMQWTGLDGMPVRWVKEEVQKRLGGEGPSVDHESPSLNGELAKLSPAEAEEACILPTHFTLTAWERSLEGMAIEDVQALVTQVKQEMHENGQFGDNWRELRRLKAEKKARSAEV